MASLFHCLVLCWLLPTLAMSLAINLPLEMDGSLTLAYPSSLPQPLNASAATSNSTLRDMLLLNQKTTTASNRPSIECGDSDFGHPPVASCRDALDQLPHDPRCIQQDPTFSYGERTLRAWDVNLPKRYISCELLMLPRLRLVA